MPINPVSGGFLNMLAQRGQRRNSQLVQGLGVLANIAGNYQSQQRQQQQYDTQNQLARDKFDYTRSQGQTSNTLARDKFDYTKSQDEASAILAKQGADRDATLFDLKLIGRSSAYIDGLPEDQRPGAYQAMLDTYQNLGLPIDHIPPEYDPGFTQSNIALSQSVAKQMAGQEAPPTGSRIEGGETVSTQWNPQTGIFDETGRGPRWNPKETKPKRQIIGPDSYEDYFSVDPVTNTKKKLIEEGGQGRVSQSLVEYSDRQGDSQGNIAGLEKDVRQATGPYSNIAAGLSNTLGAFFMGDAIFKDTTDSRERVRIFSQLAKRALVNNKRFPVKEVDTIKDLLPDPDTFFVDSSRAVNDVRILHDQLNGLVENKERLLRGRLTKSRRGDLLDEISTVNEVLYLMDGRGDSQSNLGASNISQEIQRFGDNLKSQGVSRERIIQMIQEKDRNG